jgi:hypothetical protein
MVDGASRIRGSSLGRVASTGGRPRGPQPIRVATTRIEKRPRRPRSFPPGLDAAPLPSAVIPERNSVHFIIILLVI